MPLLHLFNSYEIEIILLDIYQTSINSVKKNVKTLSYQSYIKEYLIEDATIYKHSKENSLHMIITESMDKALIKEPQVEIIRNLGKQLVSNGTFIPEEIERGYSFLQKNFFLIPKKIFLTYLMIKKK